MKKLFIVNITTVILIGCLFSSTLAQASTKNLSSKGSSSSTQSFDKEKALLDFLNKNLKYPAEAKKQKIEGKVFVSIGFLKNGRVDKSSVRIKKGIGGGCDEEAVRVAKKIPKKLLSSVDGKPMVLPVRFSLK